MARTKKDRKAKHIDPNRIKIRDELLKALILGVTKAGVIPDRRKARNKYRCRNSRNGEWD